MFAANCADSWAVEVLGVAAANLGGYVGLMAAGAIRISSAMGRNKGSLACRHLYTLLVVAASLPFCLVSLRWGCISHHPEQRKGHPARAAIKYVMGAPSFVNSVFYAFQGPFRGTGYNCVMFGIPLIGMWGVAVPLALLLPTNPGYGVRGVMYSLGAGAVCNLPMQLGFLWILLPWELRAQETAHHHTGAA